MLFLNCLPSLSHHKAAQFLERDGIQCYSTASCRRRSISGYFFSNFQNQVRKSTLFLAKEEGIIVQKTSPTDELKWTGTRRQTKIDGWTFYLNVCILSQIVFLLLRSWAAKHRVDQ
ncbi:hypothetical protein NPIL_101131 [Nephila pilipes]|uniref:Uncharacterized protein n=1 Tax=Nephila pilipes TaxID=299642 RepID=A0A8X6MMH0_NEPPI|nr:hypothetical protein NPIL_101131 [Nephila pilipes]